MVADREIERLRKLLAPYSTSGDLDELCYCIENFDFQRATQLLDQIMATMQPPSSASSEAS